MKSLLAIFFLSISHAIIGQQIIVGQVVDESTREPLPFATLTFQGTTIGTVSNAQGNFQLQTDSQLNADSLVVSYIGYESIILGIDQFTDEITIQLTPSIIQLDELVILPLSPEEYLRIAVRKYSANYAANPFTTTAYYREVFTENKQYITFNEGVFYSSYPDYQDTTKNQHQLALYRSGADKENIDFMSSWVEKKREKEKKKTLKKGEEWTEEESEARDIIQAGFGGPEEILGMDLMKDTEYCLDSTKFRKFKYQFGNGLTYQGREIIEILFQSKGQVDNQKMKGVIHLDVETDAIVSVSYQGELVIPVLIKPILFAFGLSIKDPIFNKSLKYQYHGGRWYPDIFQWDVAMGLKKRYMVKSNEYSDFTGHQIFKVNELNVDDQMIIPEDRRFNPEKDPSEQVHALQTLHWKKINTLPIEDLGSR